jgi:Domain of unknown function (DUF4169)
MSDVVNLRTIRKAKSRLAKEIAASENRAKFGQSLAEKQLRSAIDIKRIQALDGHKLTDKND